MEKMLSSCFARKSVVSELNSELRYISSSTLNARWKSSTSQDDYQFWQVSRVPTMHFQKSLPRLPIPELSKTCERYLRAQRPLLDDGAFKKTEACVHRFLSGKGISLQKQLKIKDSNNKHTSYIAEPWFDMYLRDRAPLPINYNPVMVYNDDPNKEYNNQLVRATNILISSLRFLKSLYGGVLEPEVFHMNPRKSDTKTFRTVTGLLPSAVSWYGAYMFNAYPLDMSQYKGLFNATRIPELDKDRIFRDPTARHMLVLRNGHFFVFDVLDGNGNIVEQRCIMACLKYILDDRSPANDYPIGLLTTSDRNNWARVRKHLETVENSQALQLIDRSIFCLCLDDTCAGDNPEEIVQTFLHSDGTNRWFDKSFSVLVSRDGKAAVNFEHSWGDGVAVLRYCQDTFTDSTRNPRVHPGDTLAADYDPVSLVKKLDIVCDNETKRSILEAKEKLKQWTSSLGINMFEFPSLGKTVCKAAKISPDSVMQLGFQLAYNKLCHKYVGTYESCSTAAFKHGRTETIRPCTEATKVFCEALRAAHRPSREELQKLLHACSSTHGKLTKEAAMGQGFDRHLFALRKIAESNDNPLPDLYEDKAYANINHNILSTSTLSSEMLLLGGFGPVVKDGFGIGYGISDDKLGAVVTNYTEHSDGAGFISCLQEAFEELHKVLK